MVGADETTELYRLGLSLLGNQRNLKQIKICCLVVSSCHLFSLIMRMTLKG